MADNLDAFGNGGGQGADRGGYPDGRGRDHTGVEAGKSDHAAAEQFRDGYETLNNVAGWQIPEGAIRTEALRQVVIRLVAQGLDDPHDLATLTLPGLVATIGELEKRLAEQDDRIDMLIAVVQRLTG